MQRFRMGGIVIVGLGFTACGIQSATPAVRSPVVTPPPIATPVADATNAERWIEEPQDGITPYLHVIDHATRSVEINAYLMTDPEIFQAIRQATARGITVSVMLEQHPFQADADAQMAWSTLHAIPHVAVRWAPSRFDQPYAVDHAKYLIADAGTSHAVAILGSANFSASAFNGSNAEDAVEITSPRIVGALQQVFHADWTGTPVGESPRHILTLSPGFAGSVLPVMEQSTQVDVITEELGDVPNGYAALARLGSRAHVLVPTSLSSADRIEATTLERSGVQVRTLASPYPHGKLILTPTQVWVGSQNWSGPSWTSNREVGIWLTAPSLHHQASVWFETLWRDASPLPLSATTSPPTVVSSGHQHVMGDSTTQVQSLDGRPSSTWQTRYQGTPETAWQYPWGIIYFESGRVVYVDTHS